MAKKIKYIILTLIFLNLSISFVSAQVQDFNFSGNDPESYQCLGEQGQITTEVPHWYDNDPTTDSDNNGNAGDDHDEIRCNDTARDADSVDDKAILKPPKLQQIEIWFVRILYVIWGLVAGFSFLMLVALGYQYMLRGGTTDTQLVELRRRIIYYIVGVAIVFLSVPILSTIFRLMQVNSAVDCYNVNMPGFQFFYASLCTDPNGSIVNNPCSAGSNGTGIACPTNGAVSDDCEIDIQGGLRVYYICSENIWIRQVDRNRVDQE